MGQVGEQHWFLAANKNVSETVEMAFLDGNQNPTLEQDDPFTSDGVTLKVRLDMGARALEFRGMSRAHNGAVVE